MSSPQHPFFEDEDRHLDNAQESIDSDAKSWHTGDDAAPLLGRPPETPAGEAQTSADQAAADGWQMYSKWYTNTMQRAIQAHQAQHPTANNYSYPHRQVPHNPYNSTPTQSLIPYDMVTRLYAPRAPVLNGRVSNPSFPPSLSLPSPADLDVEVSTRKSKESKWGKVKEKLRMRKLREKLREGKKGKRGMDSVNEYMQGHDGLGDERAADNVQGGH